MMRKRLEQFGVDDEIIEKRVFQLSQRYEQCSVIKYLFCVERMQFIINLAWCSTQLASQSPNLRVCSSMQQSLYRDLLV